jgi:hypothetical protein
MSTIAAGTTSGTALVSTGDTNGTLVLQTNGTTTAVTIGTNQVVTLAQPLPAASGGTGSTATPTAGGIPYGTGSATAFTAAGTSGQFLTSAGSSAPTWSTPTVIGAVDAGSVVMLSRQSIGQAQVPMTVAFNGYNQYKTASTGTLMGTMGSSVATDSTVMMGKPIYSSYYGLWFVAGTGGDGSARQPLYFTSVNGVNWNVNTGFLAYKISVTASTVSAVSIAVNSSGVIQLLLWSSATGNNYVAASSDGGYTWTGDTNAINNSNGAPGYAFNCSIGSNFYVVGKTTSYMFVTSYDSTGTTAVGTSTSNNISLWNWPDWSVTASGIYINGNSTSLQTFYYNVSAATLNPTTGFGAAVEGTTISNNTTYVLAGCYNSSGLYYTSNIDSTSVTWSSLSANTITGGSSIYTRWVRWTGSAWLAAFWTNVSANPSFGGSAVYYNTSSNPGAGTWTKMTVNLGLANQYGPFIASAVSYGGVGARTA